MKRLSPTITIVVLILGVLTLTNCKTTAPENTETTIAAQDSPMIERTVSELVDTRWVIESIDGQDVVDGDNPASIDFLPDGSIASNASCNRLMGSYEHGETAGEISFKPNKTTMMMCAEEVMEQEKSFLALLPQITSYTMDDATLTLKTDDGKTIIARRR